MVSIAADKQDVEHCLQKIVELSQRGGAEFSNDVVLKCLNGYLSVEAPPDVAGKVLMRVPWNCLVPLPPFDLRIVDNDIVISSYEEGLTRASVALMEAMLELYNLTNKLAEHRVRSPWPLIASHPELLNYVMQRRGPINSTFEKLVSAGDDNALLLETFLNTRFYGYNLETGSAPPFPVLMPVIDFFNHLISGAGYHEDRRPMGRVLSIRRSAQLPGTGNECFAVYGPYDTFDTWVTYDFIDGRVSFVGSIAMTIDLPGIGAIQVTNLRDRRRRADLPEELKDLWFYIPKVLAKRPNRMVVSSLLIPGPEASIALQRTLRLLIAELSPGHAKQGDLVVRAEEQIVSANRTYYRNVISFLQSLPATEIPQKPILDNFIRVCEIQLARIQVYSACAGR